ncbi:aminodeoxychorismate synthase component I [Flavobacteriaceae bacterium F08102]|nr:aminodeoxychorismate synthase component I [Flavobacteriaceae bacterium F08102]
MRQIQYIRIDHTAQFTEQLLLWAQQYKQVIWLDSNNYPQQYGSFEAVLAVDAASSLRTDSTDAFEALKAYHTKINDYIFGYLSYDLKNDTEKLSSKNQDGLQFPDLYFFQPKKLFFISKDAVEVHYMNTCASEIKSDLNAIHQIDLTTHTGEENKENHPVKIKKRISKSTYLNQLNKLQAHILRGDIYEVNFCQEFYAENTEIHPLTVYQRLNAISNAPFASYSKLEEHYILCASPERFIRKKGDVILSQPIKGTAKRLKNKKADKALALKLEHDQKERAENIMIVDLVRNDLSKIAQKGTVHVEELCKVYSFDQVHQLISTISARVAKEVSPISIIKSLFPMGSMTGAPKLSAMQLIERYEASKRGVYSGAIGYLTPDGDFDFNVVIRSILYNAKNKYLSYSVGGAITAKSIPEKEYEECLLKAIAMKKSLVKNTKD